MKRLLSTSISTKSSSNKKNQKMNLYLAINSALKIALETDNSAILFGEDVSFGKY